MGDCLPSTENPKFCGSRPEGKCPHGNDYAALCDAEAQKWNKPSKALKARGLDDVRQYPAKFLKSARLRGHEAHHIACCTAVSTEILGAQSIRAIVDNTNWCINAKSNLIALPMWAHTLQWYTDLATLEFLDVPAPPFKNLAQHNYDHAQYNLEVAEELQQVVRSVQAAAKKTPHPKAEKELKSQLDDISELFRDQLTKGRNTHKSWDDGFKDPDGDWYEAFSMANTKTPYSFPCAGNKMMQKLERLAELFDLLP